MDNQKIHFIGIKGVGMTALAILAKEKGYEVTGSDIDESFVTDKALAEAGISVFNSFDAKNIGRPDLVVVSAAYGKENPEVKEAQKKHLDLKLYSEALNFFALESQLIAVSGIHGKTTIASLLSFLLSKANLDPSFVIGAGKIDVLGRPGHFGKGDYFIAEADEYRKSPTDNSSKFFDLSPQIEIITSIEMDHPDIFSTEEKVYDAFYKFACRIPRQGFIVLNIDYPKSRKLLRSLVDRKIETYGISEDAEYRIIDVGENPQESVFSISHHGKIIGPFKLKIPGLANISNATAVVIAALKIGISDKLIKKELPLFSGVKRRFEIIGQIKQVTIIDDYAHHPRSIKLTIEAAKVRYPGAKIWCIFQPHTYSRTKELLSDFALCFRGADQVIITDIYASARETEAVISGEDLALAIRKNQKKVKYIADWPKIVQEVIDNLSGPTIVLAMGAGDIYKLANLIWARLKDEA